MMTIHLNEMIFFAHHGLYDEEKITGARFKVNVDVSFKTGKIETIIDTINYVLLYELIKKRFANPALLLEMLAQDIAEEMYKVDGRIAIININIQKLNPPIYNFTGYVGITYSKSF